MAQSTVPRPWVDNCITVDKQPPRAVHGLTSAHHLTSSYLGMYIGSSAAKLFQIALPDQRIPPLLLTIGDLQRSNIIRHPDLATFLFECMKDNWYRVLQYPLLLDGIAGPIIYLPFTKNDENDEMNDDDNGWHST
jgi:hypothetical protein